MNHPSADLMTFRAVILAAILAGWLVFVSIFWLRRRPPKAEVKERQRKSYLGIVLQGIGYALVWGIRRPWLTPIAPMPAWAEIVVGMLATALMGAGVWMSLAAVRALGKQWSFEARLVEGHRLVTEGPFRIVRNPIYSGMLGKLVATGLAMCHWAALLGGVILFFAGTAIRIRSEEALLRGAFGQEFEEYARRVPALIPGLR